MKKKQRYIGFSLTEILLAVGTLSIGLLFIAGTFMTGIYFSTIATERTTAAVAADEAFAKIMLYNVNPADLAADELKSFEELSTIDPNEFAYPSTDTGAWQKQYYWSALCRRASSDPNSRLVQITVFVSRKVSAAASYQGEKGRPIPMKVGISGIIGQSRLTITEADKITWINDGYTVVDDKTGQIYRVIERDANQTNRFRLDRPWQGEQSGWVWVVPPPLTGGKNPNITIYQKIVRF
jgi:type II secretory pathway pseudopilin PulG